jgi:hypothetical protein
MPISLNLKNLVVFMGPKLNLTPQLDFIFIFFFLCPKHAKLCQIDSNIWQGS